MLQILNRVRPEAFLTDLVRDGAWIQLCGPCEFYWLPYEGGTHTTTDRGVADGIAADFTREGTRFAYVRFDSYGNMDVLGVSLTYDDFPQGQYR